MALENPTYIDDFVITNPEATDSVSQGDDHLRNIKKASKGTFPNADKPFYFPTAAAVGSGDSPYAVGVAEGTNRMLVVDASGGNVTVQLPAAASAKAGAQVRIIRTDTTANTLTVEPNGSEKINGEDDVTIPAATSLRRPALTVESDGSNWHVTAENFSTAMTTAGDMLYLGASGEARLGIGAANTILGSNGSAPLWRTVTAALDAAFGAVASRLLWRGPSSWSLQTVTAILDTGIGGTTNTVAFRHAGGWGVASAQTLLNSNIGGVQGAIMIHNGSVWTYLPPP